MCWLFSSLSTVNKEMQFLKLNTNFMKITDLGPSQGSKLEHFGKITFPKKTPPYMFETFQNPFMLSNISQNPGKRIWL